MKTKRKTMLAIAGARDWGPFEEEKMRKNQRKTEVTGCEKRGSLDSIASMLPKKLQEFLENKKSDPGCRGPTKRI